MWRLGGLLALLAAATRGQDVPRPTRLRIYVDAAIARGQAAAMAPGEVSDLTEDDGTSSPTFLHHADAIRFLERARSRR